MPGRKKKTKRLNVFKFRTFIGRFQATSVMAVKGLKKHLRLNEGDREHSAVLKYCSYTVSMFNIDIVACLQRKGNGSSTRDTVLGVDVPT